MVGVTGSIPDIILNKEGLYLGNLVWYFQIFFFKARNIFNPFHNLRHSLHVMWLCYKACVFYKNTLSQREMRNLLIAALFHDFDHPGILRADHLNIERAIKALRRHIAPEDREHIADIEKIIEASEYPYSKVSRLLGSILRDADRSQVFSPSWIQMIVGLAAEWKWTPIKILRKQEEFLRRLEFESEWGQQNYTQEMVEAKIEEVRELIAILDMQLQCSL